MDTLTLSNQLTQEELSLLKILTDPVLWARLELGWEARWYQAEILRSKSRKIVIRAGRRTGKSDCLCIFALYHAFVQPNKGKDPGYRVLYVAPYESQIKEFFLRMRELISNSQTVASSIVRDVKNPHEEIEFANGSLIRGMSAGSKTGKGAANIRGQKADLLILDEAAYLTASDINTLLAIQLQDPQRIRIIAASTPSGGDTHFMRWCLNKELGWQEFHYPSWVNPNWSPEMEAELREELPGVAFTLEVEAEFSTEASGVFLRHYVEQAIERGRMIGLSYNSNEEKKGPRVLGVDWDKYANATNMAIVEFDTELGLYKPILRVEIPRSKFTLDEGVQKIISLNEAYDLDYVYVDRGYGEYQVETLHKYGLQHPESGLHEKVKGVTFSDMIKIIDPVTREPTKKKLKHWIINNLQVLFERGKIVLPPEDRVMARQFFNYRVKGYTAAGEPVYVDEDEHIIDAVGLAVHGLLTHFSDICKVNVGKKIAVVKNIMAVETEKVFYPRRRPKMTHIRGGGVPSRSFGGGIARSRF